MTARRGTGRGAGTLLRTGVLGGGLLLGLLLAAPATASHNDSTPIGLRITVTAVNPGTGTVDFDITVVDSDITSGTGSDRPFTDIAIGQRFTHNRYTYATYNEYVFQATNIALPPAIDFGDGATVPYTRLPLVSDITMDPGTFRGSFSHSYATDGVFTITAFVAGHQGVSTGSITTGNAVSQGPLTLVRQNLLGSDTSSASISTDEAVGISNTAQVTVQIDSIPTVGNVGLLALGALVAAIGILVMRRAS